MKKTNTIASQYKMSPEYIDHLSTVIGHAKLESILKLRPSDLRTTIRLNLMRFGSSDISSHLQDEGISIQPIPSIPEAYEVVHGKKKVGFSYGYLSGEIMPQGFGSMLSVHLLDPKPGDTILDLAAAPGGKTCFIGERMKNEGLLVANEFSFSRSKSLIHNLSRHGISNAIITNQEGSKFSFPIQFDKILLDAPCSGDGLIVSQPNTRTKKSIQASYMLQKTQRSLLRNAIALLKPNGICVYSTCSLNSIENEETLKPFLQKIRMLKTQSPGIPGNVKIDSSFQFATRLLPTELACDGFFIAKFQKK